MKSDLVQVQTRIVAKQKPRPWLRAFDSPYRYRRRSNNRQGIRYSSSASIKKKQQPHAHGIRLTPIDKNAPGPGVALLLHFSSSSCPLPRLPYSPNFQPTSAIPAHGRRRPLWRLAPASIDRDPGHPRRRRGGQALPVSTPAGPPHSTEAR